MASPAQPVTLAQALQLGMTHFQAGRLPEAEAAFRRVLAADPNNVTALDLMGCIAHQVGKYEYALEFFKRALLHNPDDPFIHFNMGVSLEEQGKPDEALPCYRKVLALNPGHVKARIKLGVVLQTLGEFDEAVVAYRQALRLVPDNAVAHNNLGVVLQTLGKPDEAEACYRKALSLNPDYAGAHNNLGAVLQRLGNPDQAVNCYRKAVGLNPDYAEAHNNLGSALGDLNRPDEALASYAKALQLRPAYAEALSNQGNTLRSQGRLEEALACHHRALALEPDNAVAHTNLGVTLQDQGKYEEALSCFHKALEFKPDIAATHWSLALVLLLRGDYAAGLTHYEKRLEDAGQNQTATARETLAKLTGKPRWQGEDLRGKTLLVWNDQAQGDAIMMARYLPLLRDKGAGDILLACQPTLVKIMQTLPAVGRVIGHGTPLPMDDFDCHCPMMSLPYLFGTRLETVPNAVPYISVPPARAEKWTQRLAAIKGMKVGLVWAGSKTQKKDFLRSIPFKEFMPLLAIPGARFISLQKDGGESGGALLDWMAECEDFLDTAALVQQLDLVISVDTAVAHLAGALGRPVWLLNRFESEWRWLLEREDSPWYPTMRIFRQPVLHDWGSVIERVAEELKETSTANSHPVPRRKAAY